MIRKRNNFRISKLKYYSITFSTLCGILLTAGLIMLFSYAGSKADFSNGIISVLLSMSIISGGLLSGYLHGKNKRHNGIKNGILCGGILFILIFIFGILYLGTLPSIKFFRYLLMLFISGITGGISGVNSKIKHPPN